MKWTKRWSKRLRVLVRREAVEGELDEELAFHLEMEVEKNLRAGMTPDEARRRASIEFGGVEKTKEEVREARTLGWVDALAADSRFALRQFRRRPLAAVTIVAVLTLGITLATSLFAVLHSFSTQPPPGIPRAPGLVRIQGYETTREGIDARRFAPAEFEAYRGLTDRFRAVAGWVNDGVRLDLDGADRQAIPAMASFVTPDYFSTLGVRPALGTGLPLADGGEGPSEPLAVIEHAAWEELFGRDPGVIGSTLRVNGVPVTVVGVAPPRFRGADWSNGYQLWLPLSIRAQIVSGAAADAEVFNAIARLRPGVGLEAAASATRVIGLGQDDPAAAAVGRRTGANVVPLRVASDDPESGQYLAIATVALGVLGALVLLVTCTNVSALLTGLAMGRRREIAVRLSLGAGRGRLVRQLLTESVLLALVAAAASLALVTVVFWSAAALLSDLPVQLAVHWPAMAFSFGVALAVGIVFGLSPALHATRLSVASALKDSAGTIARGALQRRLVVAQIAFTQPLIVALAVVLLDSLGEYQRMRMDESATFADRIVSLSLRAAPPAGGPPTPGEITPEVQARREEIRRMAEQIEMLPGVAAVVQDLRATMRLDGYSAHPDDRVAGGRPAAPRLSGVMAAQGYFDVMGIRLLLGDPLPPAGAATLGPVEQIGVIVGDELARRMWPGANPLGRRLIADSASLGPRSLVVVGVFDAPETEEVAGVEGARFYFPADPSREATAPNMLVRIDGPVDPLIPRIRATVQEFPGFSVLYARTLADAAAEDRVTFYLTTGGVAVGGFLALLLSAVGLYAVVSFAVAQRTREIAVRMAIGARSGRIVGSVVADGARLSGWGLLLGLPLGLAAISLLPLSPGPGSIPLLPVAAMSALGVLAVAAAATWSPARRAAAVSPATALRAE